MEETKGDKCREMSVKGRSFSKNKSWQFYSSWSDALSFYIETKIWIVEVWCFFPSLIRKPYSRGAQLHLWDQMLKRKLWLHVQLMLKLISTLHLIGSFWQVILFVNIQAPLTIIGHNCRQVHAYKFIAFLVFQKLEYQWSLSILRLG